MAVMVRSHSEEPFRPARRRFELIFRSKRGAVQVGCSRPFAVPSAGMAYAQSARRNRCSSDSYSRRGITGLAIWSLMPAARQAARSSRKGLAGNARPDQQSTRHAAWRQWFDSFGKDAPKAMRRRSIRAVLDAPDDRRTRPWYRAQSVEAGRLGTSTKGSLASFSIDPCMADATTQAGPEPSAVFKAAVRHRSALTSPAGSQPAPQGRKAEGPNGRCAAARPTALPLHAALGPCRSSPT